MPALTDFLGWLQNWMNTPQFTETRDKYIALHSKLKYEKDEETRGYLLAQIRQLEGSVHLLYKKQSK